ncbi:MAG: dephospho-CoA kinase [Pirellulales bacterium]
MRVIGILGGVASGKSQVTRMLAELGCGVLDADRAGHEVLREIEVKKAIRDRWGEGVFNADGEVDRRAVAKIVFASPLAESTKRERTRQVNDERRFLERLTHGRISAALRRQADELIAAGRVKAIVLDAALLLEAGWDGMCDALVFVDAPQDDRRRRAATRGWSDTEFAAREAAQESLEAKRRRADFEIDNSVDLETLRDNVEQFLRKFLA